MESRKVILILCLLFVNVLAADRGVEGVSFLPYPQRLDWSMANNLVTLTFQINDDQLVEPISISFETPAGIPPGGFTNITGFEYDKGAWSSTILISTNYGINGFFRLKQALILALNGSTVSLDSNYFQNKQPSQTGFSVHYVPDYAPPVLVYSDITPYADFTKGENITFTVSATDIGGYNGVYLDSAIYLVNPISPEYTLGCMPTVYKMMDPIQTLSCGIIPSEDPYQMFYTSGFYHLVFTITDGTWPVIFTTETLAALGYTSTVYVKGYTNIANITSISLDSPVIDTRNSSSLFTGNITFDSYDQDLTVEIYFKTVEDTSTFYFNASVTGTVSYFAVPVPQYLLRNATYIITQIKVSNSLTYKLYINQLLTFNNTFLSLSIDDYEAPYLDYSFFNGLSMKIVPSVVESEVGTLLNITFRIIDNKSGFAYGDIFMPGSGAEVKLRFDASNRTSGDIYDGIYNIELPIWVVYGRFSPVVELTDNAGNIINMGATGYVDTNNLEYPYCHDGTYTPDDYYIASTPFTIHSPSCSGDERQYIFYVAEESSVTVVLSSDTDPVQGLYIIGDKDPSDSLPSPFSFLVQSPSYVRVFYSAPWTATYVNMSIDVVPKVCSINCNQGYITGNCTCVCNDGYDGDLCNRYASCPNDCSRHGLCIKDNTCACDNRYNGTDCSACASGYWGPNCRRPCPSCVNGLCNVTTGKCDCIEHVQGYLCDSCINGYVNGEGICDKRVSQVLYLAPTFGYVDSPVIIKGINLDTSMDVTCYFADIAVNGTAISEGEVECIVPQLDNVKSAQVMLFIDGNQVDGPVLMFSFSGDSCDYCNPSGGGCFLGICVCYENFTGSSCDFPREPPSIFGVSGFNAEEGQDFVSSEISLINNPDSISLIDFPKEYVSDINLETDDNYVDFLTTKILWNDIPYGSYDFTFLASNKYGQKEFTTNIVCRIVYYVEPVNMNGFVFYVGDTIQLNGTVSPTGTFVDVTIKIWSGTVFTMYNVTTDVTGRYYFNYTTTNSDIGNIAISVYHYDEATAYKYSASVSGFKVQPAESLMPTLEFYYGGGNNKNNNTLYIENLGYTIISGMRGYISDIENNTNIQNISLSLPATLSPSAKQYVTVTVNATGPVSTQVRAIFTSLQGVSVPVIFKIRVRNYAPKLEISGNIQNVKEDGQSLILVTVTNVGGSPSGVLSVSLPQSIGISLVSPPLIPSLAPGASYTLTFMVTPTTTSRRDAAADLVSQVLIYSDTTSVSSTIRATPVTSVTPDVIIQVQDEKGPLDGATVTVTFNTTIQSQTTVSGSTTFTLPDVGQLDIQVEADNHSPSRQTITVTQPTTLLVLLSTVAAKTEYLVRYDTNTETTSEPTPDTTPESSVPSITPSPTSVSLLDITSGATGILSFTLSNKGTVTAENVMIKMPQIEGVTFTQNPSTIGDIPPQQFAYISFYISTSDYVMNITECMSASIMYSSTIGLNVFNYTSTILFRPQGQDCTSGYGGRTGGSAESSRVTVGVPYANRCLRTFNSLISGFPNFGCPSCVQEKLTGVEIGNIPNQVVLCLVTCDKSLPVNITQIYNLYTQLSALRTQCKFDASESDSYNTVNRIYDYLDQLSTYLNLIDIVFNDDAWKNCYRDAYWSELFLNVTSESSDKGIIISDVESAVLTSYVPSSLNDIITSSTVSSFIARWNHSFANWQQADFTSSLAINYDNLYTGFQSFKVAQATAKALGSVNFADGIQNAIQQLKLNINQESDLAFLLSLESSRSAVVAMDDFTVTMSFGSIPSIVTNLTVNLQIRDRFTGNDASSMVSVSSIDVVGISGGIQGAGAISAGNNGTVTWHIQALNTTSSVAEILVFGGYISYSVDGQFARLPFYEISVVIYPSILIHVDYFIPASFRGDDPQTSTIEDSAPTQFAMTLSNKAGGYLTDLNIASLTSSFVDISGIVKVQYQLLDTQVFSLASLSSEKVVPTFNLNMGDVLGTESTAAIWTIVPSYSGKFAKFSTGHKHIDETGFSRTTSVVKFTSHKLYKIVRTTNDTFPAIDMMPSFLTDENGDGIPDSVFNGLGDLVSQFTGSVNVSQPTSLGNMQYGIQTGQSGISFVSLPNPYTNNGTYTLTGVTRGLSQRRDTSNLNANNFWQTSTSLNIFDDQSTGSYTLTFTELTPATNFYVTLNESNRIGLAWEASPAASVYKLVYQKTGAPTFLTLSTTILDTSYLVTGLQADSTYTFKLYSGNGVLFESIGSAVEASTGTPLVTCSDSLCKNNGTAIAAGGACYCVCDLNVCGSMQTNADCTCDQCVAANGTTITGPCDDGDVCTQGETCANGVCGGGENTCQDVCAGVQCPFQDCYNVSCAVDSQTNSPFCKNTPLGDGAMCGNNGVCQANECVVKVGEASTSSPSKSNVGAIVGGVIGGVAGAIIIVAIVVYIAKKKKEGFEKESENATVEMDPVVDSRDRGVTISP